MLNKTNGQLTEWEKIVCINTYNKGLLSKICKELVQPHTKKPPNNPVTKWAEDQNRYFSIKDIHGQETYEKCSVSLITRDMQIKTTMRYHLMPVRITVSNKSTNNLLVSSSVPVFSIL